MVQRNLEPPPGLEAPDWAGSWLGRRDEVILDHGFTADELLPGWWDEKLEAAGLAGHSIAMPSRDGGEPRLTRRVLFEMASTLEEDSPDDDYLRLLWHVLVWGFAGNPLSD